MNDINQLLQNVCAETLSLTGDFTGTEGDPLKRLDQIRTRMPELLDEADAVATCLENQNPLGGGENFGRAWNLSLELKRMAQDMRCILDEHLSSGRSDPPLSRGDTDMYFRIRRRLHPIAEKMERLCRNLNEYEN